MVSLYLPSSIPPYLTPSIHLSLSPFHHPSVSPSVSPSFTPSLSLPVSLPVSLPLSLPHTDMNSCLTDVLMRSCVSPSLISERFAMVHIMLVSILHNNIGSEVGKNTHTSHTHTHHTHHKSHTPPYSTLKYDPHKKMDAQPSSLPPSLPPSFLPFLSLFITFSVSLSLLSLPPFSLLSSYRCIYNSKPGL